MKSDDLEDVVKNVQNNNLLAQCKLNIITIEYLMQANWEFWDSDLKLIKKIRVLGKI